MTPLHHVALPGTIFSAEHATALLRAGADVHARAHATAPSPLDLANTNPESSAAALVLRAAEPWSRASCHLFPPVARTLAVQLLRAGHHISMQTIGPAAQADFLDAWEFHVMPQLVTRHVRWRMY